MTEAEGLSLIAQECRRCHVELTDLEAKEIYKRSGGVPIVIVWTVARIGGGFNVASVLRQLNESTEDIARFCFEETIQQIRDSDSHNLIMALALFKADANRESLGIVAGVKGDISRDRGLATLEKLSLVNKLKDRFILLPLTKSFVEHELKFKKSFLYESRKRYVQWAIGVVTQYAKLGSLDNSKHSLLQHEYENIMVAIDWCDLLSKWKELAILTSHMCLFLYRQGLWQELSEIVNQGTKACDKCKEFKRKAWLYLYSILVHIERGELDQAEVLLKSTASLLESMDVIPAELQESYMHRQALLLQKRNDPEFMNLIKHYLPFVLDTKDPRRIVDTLLQLAKWGFDNHSYEKCAEYLTQALKVAKEADNNHIIAKVLTALSKLARKQGKLKQAKVFCEEAANKISRPMSTTGANLAFERAQVCGELGSKEDALLYARAAFDIFSRLGLGDKVVECSSFINSFDNQTSQSHFKGSQRNTT